jgi:hypothetical protein
MKTTPIFRLVIFIGVLVFLSSCNHQLSKKEKNADKNLVEEAFGEATPAQDTSLEVYRQQGKEIVKASFSALSSQLKSAMKQGGVPYALTFCNVTAMPITDSLAAHYDVDIKRVSTQNRNPDNAADALEESVISSLQKMMVASYDGINMVVLDQEENPVYIQHIVLADQCLQCHGAPGTDITAANYEIIKTLYPDDKATGYRSGDLRGIWRIRFNNTKLN